MSQVGVMGSHGYGYGLAISNPPKTCTYDTGLTGIMGISDLCDQVTASCNNFTAVSPTTTLDNSNDKMRWQVQ